MTVISPPRQLVSSCFGIARILFPVAIPLILLLIPAGCCYSCAIPPPETEKMLLPSPWLLNEAQVTPVELPDSELAVAVTAEATPPFKRSLLPGGRRVIPERSGDRTKPHSSFDRSFETLFLGSRAVVRISQIRRTGPQLGPRRCIGPFQSDLGFACGPSF